ncbi:mitochondrial amidoxime reducing component 2 [Biomphalaria glabrata]|nr:mitochondrial amidoxime reducing component 2 [Biomphalaria glabrata]
MVAWSSLSDHWLAVVGVTATAVLVTSVILFARKKDAYVFVGHVSGLNSYPIKSCAGIAASEAVCTPEGLLVSGVLDRHFVIVRSNGDFITQRQVTKMGSVRTSVENDELVLEAEGMSKLKVASHPQLDRSKVTSCRVWDSQLEALNCGSEASQWLSNYLEEEGLKLLVLVSGLKLRNTRCVKAKPQDKVAFPDRAPYLIATEESLADLNARIGQVPDGPITMNNFRPTIIIKGTEKPWDEDNWQRLKIGQNVYMRVLEPCGRCTLTIVDPVKWKKREDGEPLTTLKKFRLFPKVHATAPLFAVYAAVDKTFGSIKVGDPVYALKGQGLNFRIGPGV